jgi:hypothetical protein
VQWSRAWIYSIFWTLKKKIHGVKAAPKDDKQGDSDETNRCLGQVFYKLSSITWEVNLRCIGTFSSCMKGHGYAMERRYVRKSSSMTLMKRFSGGNPFLYIFTTFLEKIKNVTIL